MPKLSKIDRLAALVLEALESEPALLDDQLKALGEARRVLCRGAQSDQMLEWRKQRAKQGIVGSKKKNEAEPKAWDSKEKPKDK